MEPLGRIWEALGRVNEVVGRQGQEIKDYIGLGGQRDEYVANLQEEVDTMTSDFHDFMLDWRSRLERLEADLSHRQKLLEVKGQTRKFWTREFWLIAVFAPLVSAILLVMVLLFFFGKNP